MSEGRSVPALGSMAGSGVPQALEQLRPMDKALEELSRMCGEPITHLESRRLVAKKDAPWYRFAVGQSGEIYHLEGHEIEDGENPGQTRLLALRARKVKEAPEQAQRAAVALGHKMPEKEREDGDI
jgi:hypothetical protein